MIKFIRGILSNRLIVGGSLMFLQLLIILSVLTQIAEINLLTYILFYLLSISMVLYLVSKDDNPAYKISWIILIFTFPLLGGIFYIIWGNSPLNFSKFIKLRELNRDDFNLKTLKSDPNELKEIDEQFPKIAKYVENIGNYPLFKNSGGRYLKSGEVFFDSLLDNLKKAEKFIFMEYFIVEDGIMWDSILQVLYEKVNAGVEVRFMYDDAGCLSTLPSKYHKELNKIGIKTVRFNPFSPTLLTYLNNRNHRKICVIDGKIGYMGGANLADEYINEVYRFGHWKDTAVMIEGSAVANLTMMFLELWCFSSNEKASDFSAYLSEESPHIKGYVQPFSDSPLDTFNIGENVYMNIINSATDYVYITTPYLILDNELQTSLCVAAESGIDVRIFTPHIPDKKYVHAVTRSFYPTLIKAGVKIYEYTQGFIHSKMIIADQKIGVVGTINLDFRSFYMHFECGTLLYDCPILRDIERDFSELIKVSKKVTKEDLKKTTRMSRIITAILRMFSPMM